MKITIDGVRLDVEKATKFSLSRHDGSNNSTGSAYRSPKGRWYVYTPSQWANGHAWELSTAADVLGDYDGYLVESDKEEIARLGGLEWE